MKKKKRALITGVTGQDGSYLAEYLVGLGYEVWGLMRRTSLDPFLRIRGLSASKQFHLCFGNLRDSASLARVLAESQPDEIYNLAAQSHVGVSFKCPEETMDINYYGLGRLITEAMKVNPKVRIYQASTSEMFGKSKPPQNEKSPLDSVTPYGESKLFAHEDYVRRYRERKGLYICAGILFNHESPRRGEDFVTRKITMSLAKVKLGIIESFALGNMDSRRDWGFAGDYVRAMHLMLLQKTPKDYVIASGENHSVRDFVEAASNALEMPITWKGKGLKEVGLNAEGKVIITISKEFFRPVEAADKYGDSSKARRELGWKPEVSFESLAAMMVRSDLELLRKTL